ncbi:MAG: stage II sporulation protein R [Firmicutes bacterium]|nr:stage II sporulation protein R [Bacillota bacterium]
MRDRMLIQQCLVTLALVVVMGFVLAATYEGTEQAAVNEYEGIIRLHVIANSDSVDDQNLKLKVRDAVIEEVGKLEAKKDIDESREWLASHLDDLEAAANAVIAENGCNYRAKAELGVRWIPEKTYGDMYFPAGNYEALTITLGEGAGQNWWCVLFPPLCLITEDEEELAEMGIDSQDQIQVKSWLKEVLGS